MIQKAAHSTLNEAKSVAIGTLQKLLIERPEQEQAILTLLVDKMVQGITILLLILIYQYREIQTQKQPIGQ